jgi:N-acetyl-gamma-glutamyl-phosphate reductase
MKRAAVVLGASGYSGGELLRLLARHEDIEVAAAAGDSAVGQPLGYVHPHLVSLSAEVVTAESAAGVGADVCFSCLPGGHLAKHLDDLKADIVVDLADDFRAETHWTYGLTEFARTEVSEASCIANPGCYPTAALLALVPFARAGAVEGPVVVDAISGTSGAGRKPAEHLSLASTGASVTAYGSVSHRHVPEIERGLQSLGGLDTTVSFTPHLAPMSRGLLATVRARLVGSVTDSEANEVLHDAYDDETFVEVREDWPSTKATTGSNGAHVGARVDTRTGWLICSAAIDNLGKGAAGQALQNANLALGLPEGQGLEAKGVWP